ncbi:unnamed protein product, partial [Didymodactylos carnosus]
LRAACPQELKQLHVDELNDISFIEACKLYVRGAASGSTCDCKSKCATKHCPLVIIRFTYKYSIKIKTTTVKEHETLRITSSVNLADEIYLKIANIIPCKNISYARSAENNSAKIDILNTCSSDFFSVQSTLSAQEWLYNHQNPADCSTARIAVINNYAWSGMGSSIHQIVWTIAKVLEDNRIFVYATPGNWMWADCDEKNPNCFFIPVSNCKSSGEIDGNRIIEISGNYGHYGSTVPPEPFSNQSFNWWRAQLAFYVTRFNKRVMEHVKRVSHEIFPQGIEHSRPLIALFIRRSDKVATGEMKKSYTLESYFDLFDSDARRASVRNLYLNSEDDDVFNEFHKNQHLVRYYRLFYLNQTRGYTFSSWLEESPERQSQISLAFLTDLYIESNADMHAGTLSSNWCRLIDEIRLSAGKTIPFYTPEQEYYQGF